MPDRKPSLMQRVRWWAAWPWRALFGRTPGFERQLPDRRPPLVWRVLGVVSFPFQMAGRTVRGAAGALAHWWSVRNGKLLVRGLPFLVVLTGCGYVAIARQILPEDALRRDYEQAGLEALSHKRFKEASLCFERLAQLDKERPETLFLLAQASDGLKDKRRVQYLIDRLSPRDRPVHAVSHFLKASHLLALPRPTPAQLNEAEAQLLQTLTLEPQHVQAHALLARLHLERLDLDQAERHLLTAIEKLPDLRLTLAKVYSAQNRKADALRTAMAARDEWLAKLARDPNDHAARLNAAEAEMFLERFPESVALLRQGQRLSNDPDWRMALTRVYVAWSDSVSQSAGHDPGQVLQLLLAGLKVNPNEERLFDRLMTLLKGKSADATRKMLIEQQAQGNAPALVYLLLGTDAGTRGDADQAVIYLKRAYDLDPQMTFVANNLAWFLAHKDPPELDQALSLADMLVKRFPDVPEIRDTRGQILLKLSRWEDALKDLEAALPRMRGNAGLHRGLAQAYRQLKLPELAAEHDRLADLPPEE